MRLIDADALEKKLNERYDYLLNENGPYDHFTDGYGEAVSAVEDFPTVDAEIVVRCEDCEYSYVGMSYLCCSHGVCIDCDVPPNFYCAEGKRKEPD